MQETPKEIEQIVDAMNTAYLEHTMLRGGYPDYAVFVPGPCIVSVCVDQESLEQSHCILSVEKAKERYQECLQDLDDPINRRDMDGNPILAEDAMTDAVRENLCWVDDEDE